MQLSEDILQRYVELTKQKKTIEAEMNQLKKIFHQYFDTHVGKLEKGEVAINGYILQRQIRRKEQYDAEMTIKKLEDLKMGDLIQVIKKPDPIKIKSALNLGFLQEKELEGCLIETTMSAIVVKSVVKDS